jgi:hypothetical protein
MKNHQPESIPEYDIDDDISEEDFGFILDREGNLKSVFLPDNVGAVPDKVLEILELFEIDSIESLANPTVTVH